MSEEQLKELEKYSACDVADALLKLDVPGAGFLADIKPIPTPSSPPQPHTLDSLLPPLPKKVIAPASTLLLIPRSTPSFPNSGSSSALSILNESLHQPLPNIQDGTPYADLTTPNSIVVISQPPNQTCAVVGGIMAVRMKMMGVKGVVVDGRVRDLGAQRGVVEGGVPVWSRGTSVIGAGAETKAWATGVAVNVGGSVVEPGDIVMIDPEELGVVSIPRGLLGKVLEMLPKLVEADGKVIRDVEGGMTVGEAFKLHRGK